MFAKLTQQQAFNKCLLEKTYVKFKNQGLLHKKANLSKPSLPEIKFEHSIIRSPVV